METEEKFMSTYRACSIVEGFSGEDNTLMEHIESWAYLIENGEVWRLQGWCGRNAHNLIELEIIDQNGKILKTEEEIKEIL